MTPINELYQVSLDMLLSERSPDWALREVCLGLEVVDRGGDGALAGHGNGWSDGSGRGYGESSGGGDKDGACLGWYTCHGGGEGEGVGSHSSTGAGFGYGHGAGDEIGAIGTRVGVGEGFGYGDGAGLEDGTGTDNTDDLE